MPSRRERSRSGDRDRHRDRRHDGDDRRARRDRDDRQGDRRRSRSRSRRRRDDRDRDDRKEREAPRRRSLSPPRRRRHDKEDREPKKPKKKEDDDDGDVRDDSTGHYEGKAGAVLKDRYEVVCDAGMGTFGRVVECIDLESSSKRRVCIKVVRRISRYTESAAVEADILREVNKSPGAGGDLIVKLLSTFEAQGHYCLVFEKCGASLYEFLKANQYNAFSPRAVRHFSRQLLQALNFLHNLKLIHTDLKLENVLLRRSESTEVHLSGGAKSRVPDCTDIVVIDFGGATYDHERKSSIVNTRQYRAPEVILGVGWSLPSDLWSCGCIIAELFKGELLFATHSNTEHLGLIERCAGGVPKAMVSASRYAKKYFDRDGKSRWESALPRDGRDHVREMQSLSDYCGRDRDLLELLQGLLTVDPMKRLTAHQALQCAFVHE
ncbi:kinase-like domain-containing protein [Pelagophyceae sp. CCMP2097]|nr:kinase-like domain-containing protein [Pelagophyceae sp. CCMP2097]